MLNKQQLTNIMLNCCMFIWFVSNSFTTWHSLTSHKTWAAGISDHILFPQGRGLETSSHWRSFKLRALEHCIHNDISELCYSGSLSSK